MPLMQIWRLTPRDVDDPSWQASSHRGVVWVRAPDERAAREEAQKAFGLKTRFPPETVARGLPWLEADMVRAEIKTNVRHDAEGAVGVLEPSFATDLQAQEKEGEPH